MTPERQVLLLAIAARVSDARMVLQVREARMATICDRPRDFSAAELLGARWRVVEAVEQVNAWCEVFERESQARTGVTPG